MSQAKHLADQAAIGKILHALGQHRYQPRLLVTQQRGVGELPDVLPLPMAVGGTDAQDEDGNWQVLPETMVIDDAMVLP